MNNKNESRWVYPSDRSLKLLAALENPKGWCVKNPDVCNEISEDEQQLIINVIQRSQQLQLMDEMRISRLQDRLNNMKRNVRGGDNGCCAMCNDPSKFWVSKFHTCKDCNKAVCNKCSIDTFSPNNDPIWLCKICFETRELWKKSGAWFLNAFPKLSILNESIKKNVSSTSFQNFDNCHQKEDSKDRGHLSSVMKANRTPSPSPRKTRYGITKTNSDFSRAFGSHGSNLHQNTLD